MMPWLYQRGVEIDYQKQKEPEHQKNGCISANKKDGDRN